MTGENRLGDLPGAPRRLTRVAQVTGQGPRFRKGVEERESIRKNNGRTLRTTTRRIKTNKRQKKNKDKDEKNNNKKKKEKEKRRRRKRNRQKQQKDKKKKTKKKNK